MVGYFLQGGLKFGGYELWKDVIASAVGAAAVARFAALVHMVPPSSPYATTPAIFWRLVSRRARRRICMSMLACMRKKSLLFLRIILASLHDPSAAQAAQLSPACDAVSQKERNKPPHPHLLSLRPYHWPPRSPARPRSSSRTSRCARWRQRASAWSRSRATRSARWARSRVYYVRRAPRAACMPASGPCCLSRCGPPTPQAALTLGRFRRTSPYSLAGKALSWHRSSGS